MVLVVNPFSFNRTIKAESESPVSLCRKRSSEMSLPNAKRSARSPNLDCVAAVDKNEEDYGSEEDQDTLFVEAAKEMEQLEKWHSGSKIIDHDPITEKNETVDVPNSSQANHSNINNPCDIDAFPAGASGTNPWDGKALEEWLQGGSELSERFNDLVQRLTMIMKRKVDRVNTCRSILEAHQLQLHEESVLIDRARLDINRWAEVIGKEEK